MEQHETSYAAHVHAQHKQNGPLQKRDSSLVFPATRSTDAKSNKTWPLTQNRNPLLTQTSPPKGKQQCEQNVTPVTLMFCCYSDNTKEEEDEFLRWSQTFWSCGGRLCKNAGKHFPPHSISWWWHRSQCCRKHKQLFCFILVALKILKHWHFKIYSCHDGRHSKKLSRQIG